LLCASRSLVVLSFQIQGEEDFHDFIWKFPKGKALLLNCIYDMMGFKIRKMTLHEVRFSIRGRLYFNSLFSSQLYRTNVTPPGEDKILSKLSIKELGDRLKVCTSFK